MRRNSPRGLTRIAAPLMVALGVAACQAEPPGFGPGTTVPPPSSYAALASCAPAPGCDSAGCTAAQGAPDGKVVDLSRCSPLDLTFAGGAVMNRGDGQPDITVYTTTVRGVTRVEASADGRDYVTVGYIGGLPPGVTKDCLAPVQGQRASVDLDSCNTIQQVTRLRLLRDPTASEAAVVDAVQAVELTTQLK